MSTVAIALLTWNRAGTLERAIKHSLSNAGRKWDELIWVDNGSEQFPEMQKIMEPYAPTATVHFKENTGMNRGFNTAMSLCRSDYVVPFPPDHLYPDGWLETFMRFVEAKPETGMVFMYTVPLSKVMERNRASGPTILIDQGLAYRKALPMELLMYRRDILSKVGYYREDFSPYAWADVEWGMRAEKVMNELGIGYYLLENLYGQHIHDLPSFGTQEEYLAWKKMHVDSESNRNLMRKCIDEGHPFSSPF